MINAKGERQVVIEKEVRKGIHQRDLYQKEPDAGPGRLTIIETDREGYCVLHEALTNWRSPISGGTDKIRKGPARGGTAHHQGKIGQMGTELRTRKLGRRRGYRSQVGA